RSRRRVRSRDSVLESRAVATRAVPAQRRRTHGRLSPRGNARLAGGLRQGRTLSRGAGPGRVHRVVFESARPANEDDDVVVGGYAAPAPRHQFRPREQERTPRVRAGTPRGHRPPAVRRVASLWANAAFAVFPYPNRRQFRLLGPPLWGG